MNKDDILIVKYPFWMKSDQATRLYEGILKQKENGVIILPDYCDVVIAPKDVEIKMEGGEWIPVSERLPEEEHEVYCQLSDGSNAVLYLQDNWGQMEWVDGLMGTGTYDVVAWREKPEPYKKERKTNELRNRR